MAAIKVSTRNKADSEINILIFFYNYLDDILHHYHPCISVRAF